MCPSDARVVVGTLAIVVHLHEAGLGLLVDLCPTDPSLAFLAVDRQALLLKSYLSLQGKGRGCGHGHTEHSSENIASSLGKGRGGGSF